MKTSSTLLSIFGFLLTSITLSSQVYFHDFGTTSISCPFTDAPGTFDSNLSNSSWSATPNCQSFTGSSGQAISTNGGNGSFTLTFDVNSGCTLDITSFSMWTRRSGTGPTNWSLAINSTTVGSGVTSSSSSGVASGTINVSTPVTGLTGTVTVVITTSNASGSGTYRVDDFTLNGSTSCSGLPNVGFVATTSSVDEGNVGTTIHSVDVTMNSAPSSDATVDIISIENTATEDDDYDAVASSLVFTTGESYPNTKSVDITINGDLDIETDETFDLLLALAPGSTGLATVTTDQHEVTITNDDILVINQGDIVINEFMPNPDCQSDGVGEYIELYNTTTNIIDINGWTLEDDDSDSHTFSTSNGTTVILPGGYLVCAVSNSLSYFDIAPAYVYTGFTLANGGDEIVLNDGSQEICRVDYTSSTAGVSAQLPEGFDYDNANDGILEASEFISPDSPFGCGDFGTPGALNALPVSLISFTGKAINTTTLLTFTTATEENNSHFLVQRSTDGKEFETIGRLEGKGNSNQPIDYQFTDTKPLAGINYYRLQQFDFDGANEYFGPISVRFQGEAGTAPSIWPVPAHDMLEVSLPYGPNNEWLLEVYDLNGRRLLQQNLEEKTVTTSLDLSQLPAGNYLFRWMNGQAYGQQRFVKQ